MDERITAIISGDPEAFQALVEEYSPIIRATLVALMCRYGRANPDDEANELLNQFFLSLLEKDFKKLRQFRGESSLTTYLRVVASRLTLDMMRKRKHDTEHVPLTALEKNPVQGKTPEDEVERRSQLSFLHNLTGQLLPAEQLLLKLVYGQELSAQQAASVLHLSLNAYYSKKSRILKKLKNMSKKYSDDTSRE